jgi:hypothetical protein
MKLIHMLLNRLRIVGQESSFSDELEEAEQRLAEQERRLAHLRRERELYERRRREATQ